MSKPALLLAAVLLALLAAALAVEHFASGTLENWLKAFELHPLTVVLLRGVAAILAIVPSSPLVIAAGASHGLVWGSLYVLIGAELGAILAFLIGRALGRPFVERRGWVEKLTKTRYGRWLLEGDASQGRLTLAVLYCRLLPGLNLDGLSYVAGMTPLKLWRFGLATFGGLLPYTVLLIAIGHHLREAQLVYVAGLVFALIALTAAARLWIAKSPTKKIG